MKPLRHPRAFTIRPALTAFALAATFATAARGADWQALFNGRDLSAWKVFGKSDDAPIAWKSENGVLAWQKGGGNLMTKESYADFELELEWKISPGGELVVDAEIGSADWNQRVAGSKFAKFQTKFGQMPSGPILLQDHGDPVWFRNIRIRRL